MAPTRARLITGVGLVVSLLGDRPAAQNSHVQILHHFAAETPYNPIGIVATPGGGALVVGTKNDTSIPQMIARVAASGSVTVLETFPRDEAPKRLARAADGRFYGVTTYGGSFSKGSIVSISALGESSTPYEFRGREDGGNPVDLFEGPDGTLYGYWSTEYQNYTVFALDASGAPRNIFSTHARPVAVGADGSVYGLAQTAECRGACAIFRRTPSGDETNVVALQDVAFTAVLPRADGTLLALASRPSQAARCELLRIVGSAPTIIASFDEACSRDDVFLFYARGLKADAITAGVFGFTSRTVFTMSSHNVVTVLARSPELGERTPIIRDIDRVADGALWGVSTGGPLDAGTLFQVTAASGWTTVLSLPQGNREGGSLAGPLVPDADGFLYGAARHGGPTDRGTLFRLTKDGTRFQVLYTFSGGSDGGLPNALVRTPDGAIYGTTLGGDTHDGTIFRVGRSGALTTVFVFRRFEDGAHPGSLVVGRDGALYGRTRDNGLFRGGTAFRYSSEGGFSVLHPFGPDDGLIGSSTNATFLAAADGNFYGLNSPCSSFLGCNGTSLFRLTPRGDVTRVLSSDRSLDGRVLQSPDGRLWASAVNSPHLVVSSTTGAAREIVLSRGMRLATVAFDGTMYGFTDPYESGEKDIVKILPTGEVRRFASLGSFSAFSLVDGRDGFFYGTATSTGDVGVILRAPGPGPTAPSNFRIVR